MTMADRIGVMSEGRLLQVGPPAEIYDRPNSRFTADFIGDTNIFYGTVKAVAPGRSVVAAPDMERDIVVRAALSERPGSGVWVSIRPESIELQREPLEDDAVNACLGTVRDVAYLGGSSVFHVELPTSRIVKAAVPTAHWRQDQPPAQGETIVVRWPPAACVVLTS